MKLSKIKIPDEFLYTPPSGKKMQRKYDYFVSNCKFESPIVVDRHGVLQDGYTSYLLAKMFGVKNVDVEVVR